MRLFEIVDLKSGSAQFRIRPTMAEDARMYTFFGQHEMESGLFGADDSGNCNSRIRTSDEVNTVKTGDLVFSLITGKAAIVRSEHDGYLYTQNYVKIIPHLSVDSLYLAYVLNENADIKRQLLTGQQGSATFKFTVKQLHDLELPKLPSLETQKVVGELYFNQLKMDYLKRHRSSLETKLIMGKIKEAVQA